MILGNIQIVDSAHRGIYMASRKYLLYRAARFTCYGESPSLAFLMHPTSLSTANMIYIYMYIYIYVYNRCNIGIIFG